MLVDQRVIEHNIRILKNVEQRPVSACRSTMELPACKRLALKRGTTRIASHCFQEAELKWEELWWYNLLCSSLTVVKIVKMCCGFTVHIASCVWNYHEWVFLNSGRNHEVRACDQFQRVIPLPQPIRRPLSHRFSPLSLRPCLRMSVFSWGCVLRRFFLPHWNTTWLVVSFPSWKILVTSQWEGWHPIYYGKYSEKLKPPISNHQCRAESDTSHEANWLFSVPSEGFMEGLEDGTIYTIVAA